MGTQPVWNFGKKKMDLLTLPAVELALLGCYPVAIKGSCSDRANEICFGIICNKVQFNISNFLTLLFSTVEYDVEMLQDCIYFEKKN
jgi:hypothetical protein